MKRKSMSARKRPGGMGARLLLAAMVLLAVLVILLRLAEFTGHRSRHLRPRIAPAPLIP